MAGTISDWLTIKLARRNGGVMEPEQRLWLFAPNLVLIPAGLILWGVGAAHHVQWFGLIFAMFLLSFSDAFSIPLSVNYVVDSYRDMTGDAHNFFSGF